MMLIVDSFVFFSNTSAGSEDRCAVQTPHRVSGTEVEAMVSTGYTQSWQLCTSTFGASLQRVLSTLSENKLPISS